MSRAALFLAFAAALTGCGHGPARSIEQLRDARIDTFSEQDLDHYLKWYATQPDSLTGRVIHFARQSVGQRYQLFVLGEFPYELTDPDPLYCLKASDCVTFVEQTYAMALSHDWPSFFRTLQKIRYKDGAIGFETRNHFTEADWNVNNAWLFEDVTATLTNGAAATMKSRIDRAAFFRKAGIERSDPVQIMEGPYVPRDRIDSVLPELCDADVIQFVKEGGGYKSVTHLGLIAHDRAGEVMLIHSGAPAVQELPLRAYLTRRPAFCGIKVLRPRRK